MVFVVVSKVLETEPWETNKDDGSASGLKATEDGIVGFIVTHSRSSDSNNSDNKESVNGEIKKHFC